MKRSGNTILVTGGGSGIGAALARRFADLGNSVIVAGRRRDALEATIAGRPNMAAMPLDIDSAAAIDAFARDLVAAHPMLNVVINNAGIMRNETLDQHRDLADAEATIVTNLLGPIRLINALIDHLSAEPDAAIVNVSSGLGFTPLVTAPVYSATKAAIHNYTLSLREALKGKVEVIELVPPAVQTGLTPGQEHAKGYMPLSDFVDQVMALFGETPTPPEILVEAVKFLRNSEVEGAVGERVSLIAERVRQSR